MEELEEKVAGGDRVIPGCFRFIRNYHSFGDMTKEYIGRGVDL